MEVATAVASIPVVQKILEYPFRFIGRHLGYLINYQTNKENLTNRVPELNTEISSIKRRAEAAQKKGEELEEYVTGWISEAERKIQEAKDVIDDRGHENAKCSCNGSFPNLVSRYKLSKKAKIMAKNIVDHIEKPGKFGNFSYRPQLPASFENKDFEAFDTRKQTLKEIMEALRYPNLKMIGVYGMGGVGKTTLVKEVARQAKEEEFFSDVVMVTVSQDVDLKSIQQGIAEGLGLELKEADMSARANRLRHRLRQEKNILIILDDIWREVDLLEVGIKFEADDQKGCKILLVSRDRDVLCSLMDVTKIIEVKVLSDREAEGLFNKFVGDKADNSDFKELANQVVGECGGLPIAIVTIACSLKNKDIFVWKDSLSRLKSSRGMEGKVYSSIKMSYDFLQNEEEKKLLLLCSLHGEDTIVRVNDLMFYGIGWDLFEGVHTMEEARCRAHSLVDKLKAHCLLLDGGYEGTVKMHDVIRDVMISIAKKDEHMHCLTKVADSEGGDFRESKAIMLLGLDFNNQLFPCLVCPKLQLLLARGTWYTDLSLVGSIPDDFFKEAQELKALSFDCMPLQSLPQSFCTLRHLRALRLRLGKNEDLTLIGELRNLIALDLSDSTFSQLPERIGKLTRLRSLNLSNCRSLRVIQPNVISSLVRLEEFYMDDVVIDWEVEGRVGEGCNASLTEFKNLQNLTTLHLNVRDANVLPKDMFSENLQRYKIEIGSHHRLRSRAMGLGFTRWLYLHLSKSSELYQYGIQKLMKNSEGMCLEGFYDVDNIVYELDIYSFPQLRGLYVSRCRKLKYLFTVAMAGTLAQLKSLEISGCPVMEEVVVTNEHREGRLEKILFPKLKFLVLKDLSNLKRFCPGDCIECPSSNEEEVEGPFFNEKVSFPILESLRLERVNLKILWADQLLITSFGMQNLKKLHVVNCDSLSHLFSLDVARSLQQLEFLWLEACKDMEEVLVTKEPTEEGTPQKISFPKLNSLTLVDLPNLRRFCAGCCIEFPSLTYMNIRGNPAMRTFITDSCNEASGELMESEARQPFFNGKVAFPKLEKLEVSGLNSVNSLFSFAVAKSLVTLKELEVRRCSLMEEIVQVNEQGRLDKISFPKLESIHFDLKRFYGGACIEFPSLLKLTAVKETEEIRDRVVLAPNLEQLTTSSSKLIKEMCNCQSSRALPFSNLKDIELRSNEPIGFSLKCIQRYQNLESLSLSGIFVDTTHHHQQLMVSLEEHERPLKHLKELRLLDVSMLTHLYEDSEDSENSFLESLKYLDIQECDRLMSPLLSSTTSFQNLKALIVSECFAMINLLASSTAKTLVHLRAMSITNCKQMTEIIADEIVDDEIVFGNLEILELCDLPSLRSFHSAGNSVMKFPNLVMLVVSQCPKMRRFSFGTIDSPKLDGISVENVDDYDLLWKWSSDKSDIGNWQDAERHFRSKKQWKGDINKTLESFRKKKKTRR